MSQSIRQQIVDQVVAILTASAPDGLTVKKGRKAPTSESSLPMVQVYWHIEQVTPIGQKRAPVKQQRHQMLEIKITVAGDDEAFDAQAIWIVQALWANRAMNGLCTDFAEGETVPFLEDSSVNDAITAGAIRYMVEYSTYPGDLTAETH